MMMAIGIQKRNWEFRPAKECFHEVSNDWDDLNRARGNHVLLDSRFVGCALRHFASPDVLLAVSRDSSRPGMALLSQSKVGFWEVFTPSQAPLGLILLGRDDPDAGTVRGLINSLPGYAVQLSVLSQDPDHSAWFPAQRDARVEILEIMQTGRVPIEGTFEDYWRARSSNLRHNLSRQRRRLNEQGRRLELRTHKNAEAVADCIKEFGQLESNGWKAESGTAVNENNAQGQFYRDLFEQFCLLGETVIFQLLVDGKVAATDLCLLRDGMMVVLKTTYDESLNQVSAALLMREEIVRQAYAEGRCRVMEFYGRAHEWHTKWTSDFRPIYHLNCHRNSVVTRLKTLIRRAR
jgi:hypothetical protein